MGGGLGEGDVVEVDNYFLLSPSQRRASPGRLLAGWGGLARGRVRGRRWVKHVISS